MLHSLRLCLLNELVVQFLVSSFYAPSAELIAQLTKEGARQDAAAAEDSPHCRMPRLRFFSLFPYSPYSHFNGRIQRNASL